MFGDADYHFSSPCLLAQDWLDSACLCIVGRALQSTLVREKRERKRKEKKRKWVKNKARTWRPINRGSLVRANGIALEEFWNGCVEMKTANHGPEGDEEAKCEAGFGRVV